ncbi:MAG TPA: ribonuclease III [Polyangiaceae bacterium]|jgi:ribonuclease-3
MAASKPQSPEDLTARERVATAFGLSLDSPRLLAALTHPSYANERPDPEDNQRLEFLGDAVLGLCVSELLCQRFPQADEGSLTRMRAQLVNAETLARWARRSELYRALRLGRGAAAARLEDSTNVLCDAVEALVAASYLDGGMEVARRACLEIVGADLESAAEALRDPKSELQERVQAMGGVPPSYELVLDQGPAHNRWFRVLVRVSGRSVGEGEGRSKRLAERAAAQAALESNAWRAALEAG